MKKVKVTYYRNKKFLWWKYKKRYSVKIFEPEMWKIFEPHVLEQFKGRCKVEHIG